MLRDCDYGSWSGKSFKDVCASEPEAVAAWLELASREGVFCEPSSAAGLAALAHVELEPGSTVVCVLTGHGLKTVEALSEKPPFSTVIDGRLDEFEEFWAAQGSQGARAHVQV